MKATRTAKRAMAMVQASKPLVFVKEGDTLVNKDSGARYRVWGVVMVVTEKYVVYKYEGPTRKSYRARMQTIPHLKQYGYEIE